MSKYLKLFVITALIFVLIPSVNAAGSTNVSILYGWNGTNFVPLKTLADGTLDTTLNISQSIGLNPKLNNSYDLGTSALLWANLYVRSLRGGSGPLSLYSGSNEALTLINGFVGINTTAPSTALYVSGNMSVNGSLYAAGFFGNGENLTNLLITNVSLMYGVNNSNTDQQLPVQIQDGALMLAVKQANIDTANSLGTGANGSTLTLSGNLTVLKNLSVASALFVDQTATRIGINTASPSALLEISGTNIVNNISLNVNNTFYVNASGNVGIGTTGPSQKLHIVDTAVNANVGLRIENDATSWLIRNIGTDSDKLYFSTATADRMVIQQDGNVGIGTTVPGARLHIVGDGVHANYPFILYPSTGTGEYASFRNINNRTRLEIVSSSTSKIMLDPAGDSYIAGGNIGIGTAAPGVKLHVESGITEQIRVRNTAAAAGKYFSLGSTDTPAFTVYNQGGTGVYLLDGGTSWTAQSDERLKNIASEITDGLGAVRQLRTFKYTWKKDGDNAKVHVGFIAQDVQKVLPEVVDTDKNGYLGIAYTETIPLLASAIKELDVKTSGIYSMNGKVGIGTTSPTATLHVAGNATIQSNVASSVTTLTVANDVNSNENATINIAVGGSSAGDPYISWSIRNGVRGYALGIDNSDSDKFKLTTVASPGVNLDSTALLTIDTSGNVGIGTTSPDEGKVEVKGGSVCVDTNSDGTAGSCIASESDVRLKTNIRNITGALDKIQRLRGVSFDWRASDKEVLAHYPLLGRFNATPHSLGLIAQEVAPVLPEAIMQETVGDTETQYLQLDYDRVIPLLVEGMKELKTEKDVEILMLKAKNNELERRIAALEAAKGEK